MLPRARDFDALGLVRKLRVQHAAHDQNESRDDECVGVGVAVATACAMGTIGVAASVTT